MKSFKQFLESMAGVPANNIAHSGATAIARYNPVLTKLVRRKPKKEIKQ